MSPLSSARAAAILGRAPVDVDPGPAAAALSGRVVMITGAGGFVGAEICRQAIAAGARAIVLFERHEHALYTIASEVAERWPRAPVVAVLGDVTDERRVGRTFAVHRPSIVIHAAAYKHVPLLEAHASETVRNNVGGTRTLVDAAGSAGVSRFVLLSTDKAVHPTGIMGTSKLLAERLVLDAACRAAGAAYSAVRFGNVFGSEGSVVPLFERQIAAGGPVTVTHPDMRRYFMTLSEAASLVLHVGSLTGPGGIYVLEMGEQVLVTDLAHALIRAAGRRPGDDIQIVVTGARPGEKYTEDLVSSHEVAEPSGTPGIKRLLRKVRPEGADFRLALLELERLARDGDDESVLRLAGELVDAAAPTVVST